MRKVVIFLYFWFCSGFFLGTFVLLGPVRWLVDWMRSGSGSETQESLSVKIILGILVLASGVMAKDLARLFISTVSRKFKWVLLLLPGLLAGGTMALWFHPQALLSHLSKQHVVQIPPFTFGSYPDEPIMKRLKDEGFTAVVSLLHPAVAPFEPKLIKDEELLAKRVGIPLIEAPMLPWISGNEASLEKIRELAQTGVGKYYVHCYLGIDRVNVVKRIIEAMGIPSESRSLAPARRLMELAGFERGAIIRLDEAIYLTPYPTDEEWFGYVLNGTIKTVVSILDPEIPDERDMIDREKVFLSKYQMSLVLLPVPRARFNAMNIDQVVGKIRDLPKPVMVHEYYISSPRALFVQKAFREKLGEKLGDAYEKVSQ